MLPFRLITHTLNRRPLLAVLASLVVIGVQTAPAQSGSTAKSVTAQVTKPKATPSKGTKSKKPQTSQPGTTLATGASNPTTTPSDGPLRVALAFSPRAGLSVFSDDAFLLGRLGVTETLVKSTASGNAEPLLASRWDQLTPTQWRFAIRAGVKFQDGSPLDASAVANAINKSATAAAPPRALRGTGMTVAVVDPLTIEVTTTRPDPLVPLRLSSPGSAILSLAAYAGPIPTPIGTATGPFRIDRFVPEQRIILSANTTYWGKTPSIKTVEARIIADPAARVAALRAGEVELAEGVPAPQLEAIRNDRALQTIIYDLPRTTTLYLNTSKPPFNSLDARKAVDLAVDRQLLATLLLEGAAVPAAGYFGPAVGWDPDVVSTKPNASEARKLAEKVALPRKLRLWTYPARAELPELAIALKAMLDKAGIDVEVTVAEYGTLEPSVLDGRFDLFLLSRSYMVDVPDPAAFLASDFTCAGGYNLNRFCDARFDADLASLATQKTRSSREQIFAAAARQLDLDVIGVPILHDKARIAHNRRLSGLVPDPLEQRLLTPELRLAQ
jgi:peptide/nickel transport system substrate-binding protein